MAKFRTEVNIQKSHRNIAYDSNILLIGSCFSDNMGQKLEKCKFHVLMNPFGVLYNPVSVANALQFLIEKKEFSQKDLFFHQGMWHSFYHHSSFSSPDPEQCLKKISSTILKGHDFLRNASHLFITFGTSWVYEKRPSGMIVSNCHKIPAREFSRYTLSVNEIKEKYVALINYIHSFNPDVHIIFTVSPIRHWKDGPVENHRSKSTLTVALSELFNQYHDIEYFPSYEIMMDDLRDYRFYAPDMLHPNSVAIDYIWHKFKATYMTQNTVHLMNEIDKIHKAVRHRPFNPSTPEHKKFVNDTIEKIDEVESQHPNLCFRNEKTTLRNQLQHL